MNQPKRVVVAYEDGSTKEADFAGLDDQLRLKLAEAGLCPPPQAVGSSQHYLVVRWEDGWQEVFAVDTDSADLLRYFVIQRIEDRGRLSVDVGEEYPRLFILDRVPGKVIEAMIVGDAGVRSYGLDTQVDRWEGIFEDGGKKEFVKYDKTSDSYPHDSSDGSDSFAGMTELLREELQKRGLSAKELISLDGTQRVATYKELAAVLGLRGGRRQEDVYGLIEMLVRTQEGGAGS